MRPAASNARARFQQLAAGAAGCRRDRRGTAASSAAPWSSTAVCPSVIPTSLRLGAPVTLISTRTPFGSSKNTWRGPPGTALRHRPRSPRARAARRSCVVVAAALNAMWSTGPTPGVASRHGQPEARRVRRVGPALGDVHARRRAGVEPVAGERERWPLAQPQTNHRAVEVARGVDVVAEHEHVLDRRHARAALAIRAHLDAARVTHPATHLGRSWAPVTGSGVPAPLRVRSRYAECSSAGFSFSSLADARELDPAALHHVRAVGETERERRELLDQQHARPRLGDRADRRDRAGCTTTGASPSDSSSMITNRGWETSAWASTTICCSPPDSDARPGR